MEDDRLEFSNNRAERSIKPFMMGRKDFLFCDTPGGSQSSAVLYSLMLNCQGNDKVQ
ncbi:IS66 family transposase [Flintibacter sp.]|uniref:IS66 family transposase n=1 Tax=Flintibacter sp. TaxID=1918624 RepID=UPI003A249AB3